MFEAVDAPGAEDTLSRVGRADVVVSDVVLPGGVSGSDFVGKAIKQNLAPECCLCWATLRALL